MRRPVYIVTHSFDGWLTYCIVWRHVAPVQWRKPGAEFGVDRTFFRRPRWRFFLKNFHFSGKNFWWPFFRHRPGFSHFPSLLPDFPDLYFVRYRTQPFPPFLLFSYFRPHPTTLLLKILGGTNAWAVPPPQTLGGTVPQSPLGFRPWLKYTTLSFSLSYATWTVL